MSPFDSSSAATTTLAPAEDTKRLLPRISIVTPSFNQAAFLERTIDSILSQGYPNLQYIVVDGGSTDGSVEIIRKYSRHLAFWCSEPDGGMYRGIRKGFTHADGDVLGWLNSDDIYLPWALQTVGRIMAELPQVEWLTSLQPGTLAGSEGVVQIGSLIGASTDALVEGAYLSSPSRRSYGFIQQESTFWRRRLWERVNHERFAQFRLAGDFYLWTELARQTPLFGADVPLACFRFHPQQASKKHMDIYLDEAEGTLQNGEFPLSKTILRCARRYALAVRLNEVPFFRKWMRKLIGYRGYKLVPGAPGGSRGPWTIEPHTFL